MLNLLQSQLSFFGAIDEAVLFAKMVAAKILMGAAHRGNLVAWHHRFRAGRLVPRTPDFANRPGVRNRRFPWAPNVSQRRGRTRVSAGVGPEARMRLATAALAEPAPEPAAAAHGPHPLTEPPAARPATEPTPEPPAGAPRTPAALPERVGNSGYTSYHDPVLARSSYAAMVLARIADLGGMPPGSPTCRTCPRKS